MVKSLKNRLIVVLTVFVLFSFPLFALSVPAMNGAVNDTANVMSKSEKNELNDYLNSLNSQTGVQIAVLTILSLEGESIEDYSMKVAEKWQLGQKNKDNGALLVVAIQDRELRIETGYGLEGSLTDAKCGLIIRNVITPYFRSNEYGKGIIAGVKNIAGVATDNAELVSTKVAQPQSDEDEEQSGSGLIPFAFVVLFMVFMIGGIGRRSYHRGNRSGGLFPFLFWSSILSQGSRNNFNNHSSHHNDFGGFSGGGFSGGGGHFGGGGASGKW